MSICLAPQIRSPTDLSPEFLRIAQQSAPSANNSPISLDAPKMQTLSPQKVARFLRSQNAPIFCAFTPARDSRKNRKKLTRHANAPNLWRLSG